MLKNHQSIQNVIKQPRHVWRLSHRRFVMAFKLWVLCGLNETYYDECYKMYKFPHKLGLFGLSSAL